ncbi:hypothetical protein HYC85_019671 [Camellia sinensis]|uniref:Cyclin-dependent kinase inhibitor domain-containing protein n=1 Tax=Camellia sinensis TaxID=4442 RepID=A0A7J7GMK8_CAMSI|nr:hypothetical protein HYC85_019671 [Camellia sinensis]
MGKYMRKAKTAGEVALMELAQSSLGVRTRAKTLALQRLQKSPAEASSADGSYLQLRSRRLEKPPLPVTGDSKRQKQSPKESCGSVNSGSAESVSDDCWKKEVSRLEAEKVGGEEEENQNNNNVDVGIEACFGENVLELEGRERSTRESTPCSLIRDPESIRTPGSTTRPTSSPQADTRVQNSLQRNIPTSHEMDKFFASAEEQQQQQFVEKYNFDPVNDEPLPGRYDWVKLDP